MKLPSLAEIDAELARRQMLSFTTYTMPGYQVNWHHEVVCGYLDRFVSGEIKRLMIFQPPRTGKSELVSRRLPAFILGRNPEATIIATSYGADLARRMNRDVQRIMDSEQYQQLFPASQLYGKNVRSMAKGSWLRNSDMFEVVGHAGYYMGTGVGGAITGMGANCLTGETLIDTENGSVAIRALSMLQYRPRVWAFDHASNRPVLKRIVAARKSFSGQILEVITVSGRCIRATAEHRFCVQGQGYKEAALLRPGDVLQAISHEQGMLDLWRAKERSRRHVRRLLPEGAVSQGKSDVRMVQQRVRAGALSAREGDEGRSDNGILQPRLRVGTPCGEECQDVRQLRATNAWKAQSSLLFARMQGAGESAQIARKSTVSMVRYGVFSEDEPGAILFSGLRQHGAFDEDARQRQLALQDGNELRQMVLGNASSDFRERLAPLRRLSDTGRTERDYVEGADDRQIESDHSPYQRRPNRQYPRKSCHSLQDLPCGAPQVGQDTVAVVRHLCTGDVAVYDLQVEKCRNFYAGGVLVHNCVIIDDPVKNRKEANSAAYQRSVFDWYTSTLYTRLAPDGQVLVTLTRWHELDLAGQLLGLAQADTDADQWQVICLPAVAENPVAPYDRRQVGDALWPSRWPAPKLRTIRQTVGSRDWASLYQQRPAPDEGNIFKRQWWRFWQPRGAKLPPVLVTVDEQVIEIAPVELPLSFDEMAQSWDLTFKATDASDFVAGQVWGRQGANKYLLDYVLDRLDVIGAMKQIGRLTGKWPSATAKLIEDKANGPAVIQMLRGKLTGLIAVEPEGGKVSRAYAAQPEVEAGNVFLPHPALYGWVEGFIGSCAAFPNAANDDDVDAFTQMIIRWQGVTTVTAAAAQVTTARQVSELFG